MNTYHCERSHVAKSPHTGEPSHEPFVNHRERVTSQRAGKHCQNGRHNGWAPNN